MIDLLLASSGAFKVFIIIAGMIVGCYILATAVSAITEKTNTKDEDGCVWPIVLVAIAIIIGILINAKSCKGSGSGYKSAPSEWQYRHTD